MPPCLAASDLGEDQGGEIWRAGGEPNTEAAAAAATAAGQQHTSDLVRHLFGSVGAEIETTPLLTVLDFSFTHHSLSVQ
jgi:hypothetical protein